MHEQKQINKKIKNRKKVLAAFLGVQVLLFGTGMASAEISSNKESGYIVQFKENTLSLYNDGNEFKPIYKELGVYYTNNIDAITDNSQNIKTVVKDCSVELYDTPNDTLYGSQTYLEYCGVTSLWDNNLTGEGVKVAVIDTGISAVHEEFIEANIETGVNICAVLDGNELSYYDTEDVLGHGTQVSGVIASKRNNEVGIAGIADECTLVPLKIQDDTSVYNLKVSSVLAALRYANLQECDVINLSLGFDNPSNELIEILDEILKELERDGVITIAAVGNSGNADNSIQYPAICDSVIGVGAVDKTEDSFAKASYSTANESVFITAPGTNIITTGINSAHQYLSKSGTSFSAPIVTSVAAMVKEYDKSIGTEEFKKILKETAVDIDMEGYDINTGYGVIDCNAILRYLQKTNPKTETEKKGISAQISYDEDEQQFNFDIRNYENEDIDAICIMCIYDENNVLQYIDYYNIINIREKDTVVDYAGKGTAKVFIWNSLESMQMYPDFKVVEVTNSDFYE